MERRKMSIKEIGRLGGKRVHELYPELMAAVGHEAGTRLRDERGVEHFRVMGSAGGIASAQAKTAEERTRLGFKGGTKLKEKRGKEYYIRIGRMSAAKRRGKTLPVDFPSTDM